MAFSLRGLLRGASAGVSGGLRGAEAGRQQARDERLEEEKLRREAEMDALIAGLREAQTERVKGLTLREALPDVERPVSVPAGGRLVNPSTGEVVAEGPARPQRPMSVAAGGRLVDPETGETIAEGGPRPEPASEKKARVAQQALLEGIDAAALELRRRPKGVGLKGFIPDAILQRTDPEGVRLRALISNIGSQLIHARSGGAVSASEFDRLAPFVPNDSDTEESVATKLATLKEMLEGMDIDLGPAEGAGQAPQGAPVGPGGPPSVPSRFLSGSQP